jgi:hypothetical protein
MATNTKNFNFKKPDESDFYSIQDQNGNWDLADEELQKLNEPAFEDYMTGTPVPPAATALEALKSKIKLPVWMSNVVAFCKGCCTLAMIVNNCVSSDADKPLAAAQGKVLQDQLTKLYSDMEIETHNLVSLLNPDFYDSNSDEWLKIYRVGNIKVIDFGFKTKALTGKDKIATDIPENLRPITAFYGGVQARDTGEWAKATYFPAVLIVTGNNLELSTGTNASRSMYVSGTVCYV